MLKALLVGTALIVATAAQAVTVLSDDFDTENGGATALNYTGFANFSVTGRVDLVAPGNAFAITAPSAVVDLDGTAGPGTLTTASYSFAAGDTVSLSFVLGGAQRRSVSDAFAAGFTFAGVTSVFDYTTGGGFGDANLGNFSLASLSTSGAITGAAPFGLYTLSFRAGSAGSLTANIGTSSADNVGPLLDSVLLDITAVPEPETWAMLVAGFGLVGFAARQRRRKRSVAA